jgi:hypothetical protein
MKKAADIKGADDAPISSTFGMEEGSGVVSIRTSVEKLHNVLEVG